ncbi:MAG TPA: RNA polymerase sigma factor [Thermoanaerobaculia bacterium]|nr:RNA polymerase sigma factor [Thermoanaerobaculia bacterium]
MLAPENPSELPLAVHRREPGAFERFVECWETPLYNYALRLLGNAFDAQEVVQDALLRAHKALTLQYDEARCRELVVRPWLFRIARNLSLNRRRGVWSRSDVTMTSFDDNRIGPFFAPDDGGRELERKEEARRLERAMAELPTESRELIFLRFMEEMPYGEIARTTGLSETQLRGKVFRSLKLLRRALEPRGVAHAV